ncbi:hypothetical protein K458DRAFT_301471 [Lentithecium fluviatile CBS 122367]|uniref:Diphthamide biosynthesis protein 4 n=1 Tax=Lentithecium fluviatile CBS 122367 TaxID=1168545 RepID=A0A6G1J349_9PLEO|nr:hypothetical protein K458DRAFT_301471 [Lentithecium fluviatile CBS 122367]
MTSYTKDYYHILGLEAPKYRPGAGSLFSRSSTTWSVETDKVRKAYRKALLGAHPDKSNASLGTARQNPAELGKYTVDDVKEAFAVLGDEGKREEYERWWTRDGAGREGGAGEGGLMEDFVLGLEVLDLGDFETTEIITCIEEEGPASSAEHRDGGGEGMEWTRACRCGAERGFRIREEELVEAEGRGESEVLVGCEGCSLWVRVEFGVEVG